MIERFWHQFADGDHKQEPERNGRLITFTARTKNGSLALMQRLFAPENYRCPPPLIPASV